VSLMKTLAKVAIGVAVAKGASSMMKNRSGGGGGGSAGSDDLGGLLGGLTGGSTPEPGRGTSYGGTHSSSAGGSGGSLEDMLGGLLGAGGAGGAGGLGGLLNQLGGGQAGAGGDLGGLLGSLAGAAGAGGLLGGLTGQKPEREEADFGAVLNSQFDQSPEPPIEPSQSQEAMAALMLSAMIQAAKSDGKFDDGEKEKLLDKLGDVDAQEAAFVKAQMQAPVDVEGLANQTPDGMAQQVYAISVLGIDLDTQSEAQYLHKLAQAYGLKPAQVNDIHAQLGVPSLYT